MNCSARWEISQLVRQVADQSLQLRQGLRRHRDIEIMYVPIADMVGEIGMEFLHERAMFGFLDGDDKGGCGKFFCRDLSRESLRHLKGNVASGEPFDGML